MINKGGRGKKAPYETTHIRVPVPLKRSLEDLIEQWIDLVNAGAIDPTKAVHDIYKSLTYSEISAYEAIKIAGQIARQKTTMKKALIKLVNKLYDKEFSDGDLEHEIDIQKDVNK
jgi:hypothetical protein